MGIINKIPSSPPVKAITVVRYISKDCQTPIKIKAGMVKIIPAAKDSPADAAVCIWFASRIEEGFPLILEKYFRANIPTTAAGIDADTVMPALRPR